MQSPNPTPSLVIVRHGQSEANVVQKAVQSGRLDSYPTGFADTPDREFRLTELGRKQSLHTGAWLADRFPEGFDTIIASDHVRAQETAGLACSETSWRDCRIEVDPYVGERNWGRFEQSGRHFRDALMAEIKRDPFHARMPDGESLLATRLRSRLLLERFKQQPDNSLLVFSHGEFIKSLWAEIAGRTTEQHQAGFVARHRKVGNCQVVEFAYGVVDSPNGETSGFTAVRTSRPHDEIFGEWEGIEATVFSPEDILAHIEKYPSLEARVPPLDL